MSLPFAGACDAEQRIFFHEKNSLRNDRQKEFRQPMFACHHCGQSIVAKLAHVHRSARKKIRCAEYFKYEETKKIKKAEACPNAYSADLSDDIFWGLKNI